MAILRTKLNDGTELIIETDEPSGAGRYEDDAYERSPYRGGISEKAGKIVDVGKNLFQEAIKNIKSCAVEISDGVKNIPQTMRPDEVEASLSFKLSGELGAVITKVGGEAQIQVKLVWKDINTKAAQPTLPEPEK